MPDLLQKPLGSLQTRAYSENDFTLNDIDNKKNPIDNPKYYSIVLLGY